MSKTVFEIECLSDESYEEKLNYAYRLKERGLYVEPLTQPLDLTRFPTDGNEFIHRQRLEQVDLEKISCESRLRMISPKRGKENGKKASTPEGNDLLQWKKEAVELVYHLSRSLNANRDALKLKFPKSSWIPLDDEEDSCRFCLGFELCSKIYDSGDSVAIKEQGHQPLLSIVLHLSQKHIEMLLEYLYKWYQHVGMEDTLSQWLYTVSVCLRQPLSNEADELLEEFYRDCLKRLKMCGDESETLRLHLFLAIFRVNFCATLLGAPLLKYHRRKAFE